MKAIVLSKYGSFDSLELRELDVPKPKADEVLILIHSTSINDWDVALVVGRPVYIRLIHGWLKPNVAIPGCDVAGIVESVGGSVPCTYPVVWVKASEAARICTTMGKRLCDAHEWEGACAGALEPPDYRFDLATGRTESAAVAAMRAAHNAKNAAGKSWSYGPAYQSGVCAAASRKSASCEGGGWKTCGSNTYPTGSFPACRSALGVFDLNGNAAEHMNLPLAPDQMASAGSKSLGVTEMKGSWFIFDSYRAHEDWCRWRAPYWHGSRVTRSQGHHNYHLGFRCCKTLTP